MISTIVIAAALLAQPAAKPASLDRIEPVPYRTVDIGGSFWGPRLDAIRRATLAANRHQCDITGRLANFDNAAKKLRGENDVGAFEGLLFNDSDVYKMVEGWCYVLGTEKDEARRKQLDSDLDALIARIAAAQHPDGYINTYYTLKADIKDRFTREEWDHETYCIGHLIEAGVAHFEATGKNSLLHIATRAADFLDNLYGPEKFTAPPGHQELELALIRLADVLRWGELVNAPPRDLRVTRSMRYNKLAHFLIEQRGREHRKLDGTMYGPWGDYAQDHLPAAEQTEAAGHAVRAAYFYCGMTDLARRGVGNYEPALNSLWTDITQRRVFVTGGIGPSGHNEGFTTPYDIPTHTAYQETCASIGLCMWAHRMFLLTGRAEYMEQFERTLYNAALAGVALDGESFFYVNPLASRGGHHRSAWFACACCPPNVLRFFGGLGQYIYATRGNTVYVNLFVDGSATLDLDGHEVRIVQETGYPFDGHVKITVTHDAPQGISLALRIPAGEALTPGPSADGYVYHRLDRGTTEREFFVPLPVRRVVADPRVKQAVGRVAIMRGPLVYAAESIDNDGTVAGIILPPDAELEERIAGDGTPEVLAHAVRVRPRSDDDDRGDVLYRAAPNTTPVKVVMRPYFMWANRGPAEMAVWLPETAHLGEPWPAPGITASASFIGHGDGLPALFDRIEPASSIDHDVPRFTFWSHKGTEEWVRYDFDKPRRVSAVDVYWFDDTGRGECRVPASWTVEYLDGEAWKPVTNASPSSPASFGVAKDRFNVCIFAPVVTGAVRVNIKLQEKYSTGILEMRVR